jgi:hypothetical protein
MMQHLASLFRVLFVFAFLIGVLCLAFFAFFILLGAACAVSLIVWAKGLRVRRRSVHQQHTSIYTYSDESAQQGVIIEGEVIETKES